MVLKGHKVQMVNTSCWMRQGHGFTLVELLLGAVVLSMIVLSVYSTLFAGMRLGKRLGGATAEGTGEMFRVFSVMTRELENACGYDFAASYPGQFSFVGERRSMVFLVAGEGGLRAVRYYLGRPRRDSDVPGVLGGGGYVRVNRNGHGGADAVREADADMALLREEIPFADYVAGGFRVDGRQEILLEGLGVDGLRLSYGLRGRVAGGFPEGEAVPGAGVPVPGGEVLAERWGALQPPAFVSVAITVQGGQGEQDSVCRQVFIPTGWMLSAGTAGGL